MIYSAEGELFKPIVIHSGNMSGFCQVNYCDIMEFIQTDDGDVNREVASAVVESVQR